ncbi:MAG: C2 domain-containing protein, partial [Linnemannia gamsii]
TLSITAHGAQNLQDVETIGKQDPYVQFSVDPQNAKSFQKSYVHKDAGKTPTWNQSFSIPLAGEPELFVEIMDEETTADAVIAFCAIPINQVVHAPGGVFNGIFDVYTPSGKTQGEINLTLTAHNVPGQNTSPAQQGGQPVKGTSHISEIHQKRVKSLANKEKAADAGGIAFGGLLAVGAGLLANKLVNDNKKEEEAKKEAERAAAAERERFDTEKKQLEAQRLQFEQQQHQAQQQQHIQDKKDKKDKKNKHHGGSDSDSSSDSDSGSDSDNDKKKKKGGKKWEAHGRWYSPGDKVKFDGDKYICLQGHNSQSDWAPTVAHSLWRRD